MRVCVGEREQDGEVSRLRAACAREPFEQRDCARVVLARDVEKGEVVRGLRVAGREAQNLLESLGGLVGTIRADEQDAEVRERAR